MDKPNFHGYEIGPDFDRARSLIATPFQYKDIDLTIAGVNEIVNISGDFLYIDPSSTGVATLELNNQYNDPAAPFYIQSGFAINAIFKQIKLSWVAQAGKKIRLMYSTGERVVPAFSAQLSISGNVSMVDAGEDYNGTFKSTSSLVGLTAEQVFSAATNTNGAIVFSAYGCAYNGGNQILALIAKAGAPATLIDGDVLASSIWASTASIANLQLLQPMKVAAGKGLYFISAMNDGVSPMRSCQYKLL